MIPGTGISVGGFTFMTATMWSDTSFHYFPISPGSGPCSGTVSYSGSFKMSNESSAGYNYRCGYWLVTNAFAKGGIGLTGTFTAYHGYGNTLANFGFSIAPPNQFDTTASPSVYIDFQWSMSSLGAANGGQASLSGYMLFTTPPSYSFTPASPSVGYSNLGALVASKVNVLFGWGDYWSSNWNQNAGSINTSTYVIFQATPPPQVKVLKALSVGPANVHIARWDDEVRLWIDAGEKGLIVPLGRSVSLAGVQQVGDMNVSAVGSPDSIRLGSGLQVALTTDIYNRVKVSNTWLLYVLYDDQNGAYNVAFGDAGWMRTKNEFLRYSLKL
jgi:hypothetical protein